MALSGDHSPAASTLLTQDHRKAQRIRMWFFRGSGLVGFLGLWIGFLLDLDLIGFSDS